MNDLASQLTPPDIQLSPYSLNQLEDLNTRWKLLQVGPRYASPAASAQLAPYFLKAHHSSVDRREPCLSVEAQVAPEGTTVFWKQSKINGCVKTPRRKLVKSISCFCLVKG